MLTLVLLFIGTFATVTSATAFKPSVARPLGCALPLLAAAATIVFVSLWPSGSSTDAIAAFWVGLSVACGAFAGVNAGRRLRNLRGKDI